MARPWLSVLSGAALAVARVAAAADGSLDPTFGDGGRVLLGLGDITAIAVYSDGRVLLGSGHGSFTLVRLHPDGTLDTTFGGDGIVRTDGDGERNVSDLVILGDERILAVGYTTVGTFTHEMRVIRYLPDGSVDTSYGVEGKVTASFPGEAVSGRAVLQPDGKLLNVAIERNGGGLTYSIALARFEPDGAPDASFGAGGQTVTNFPGMGEYGTDVVLAPDGRFYVVGVAVGASGDEHDGDWLIVRYESDGSVDATYGDDGRVTASFYGGYAYYERPMGAALQPDGKLVVGGDSSGYPALARFHSDGSLDETFGTWGKVLVTSLPGVQAAGMKRRSDGTLVLALTGYRGPEDVFTPRGFALMAFDAAGRVDTAFAACPQVFTGFDPDAGEARRLALSPDGKPIVAGGLASGLSALARYGTPSTPVCVPASTRRSTLVVKDMDGTKRDTLQWKWQGGPVAPADLGDPTGPTGYTFCVLDQSAGGSTLRLGSPMMRADWSPSRGGFRFARPRDNDFPFKKASVKVTASGTGKVQLTAKGPYLHPSLPLAPPVTVRLTRDDGEACWEATYASATENDGTRFVARSD